eukprot:5715779-Amphidinium_carterae.1
MVALEVGDITKQVEELQEQLRIGDDAEVQELRESLDLERRKLEQVAWKENIRANLNGNARHQEVCVEHEDVRAALAD